MRDYEILRSSIQRRLLDRLEYCGEAADSEVYEMIMEEIVAEAKKLYIPMRIKEKLCREIYHAVRKFDVLQEIMDDSEITEIMVNGPEDIFVEKNGVIHKYENRFSSGEKLEDIIQQMVGGSNRTVNESSPIVDARLQNGSRVNVVLPPVAINGPILTIRRFPEIPIDMQRLIGLGSITGEAAQFLKSLVIAGYNIFISGGTGSGKTTFLNALSGYIPGQERIITIEDSAELQIQGVDNLVQLETRNANCENCQPISIRDLIRASLRMRPDRIIVGEVRGPEAIDMMQALNTGHDGSLSTGHANSARDMLYRLETMILMGMEIPLTAVRRQIAGGIDVIVHLGRLRDKSRKVLEIVEVTGYENEEIQISVLYRFEEQGQDASGKVIGKLKKTGSLRFKEKLRNAGFQAEDDG